MPNPTQRALRAAARVTAMDPEDEFHVFVIEEAGNPRLEVAKIIDRAACIPELEAVVEAAKRIRVYDKRPGGLRAEGGGDSMHKIVHAICDALHDLTRAEKESRDADA